MRKASLMTGVRRTRTALAAAALTVLTGGAQAESQFVNDYPTIARADYVFGCMAANGQTRTALENCSCSIDHIASILSFEAYEKAETVLSVSLLGGERTAAIRGSARSKALVSDLKRAQAEADIVCFQ